MATVSGLTKERMIEIENRCIVSGAVDLEGHLRLVQRDGAEIDAGFVKGTKGDQGPAASGLSAWPVGSIFMAAVATSPSLLLGGGTWERWGIGRMPVSMDTTQTEFNAAEKVGGEKTHDLTAAEMPTHTHGVSDPGHRHDSNWHGLQLNAGAGGGLAMARGGMEGVYTSSVRTGITLANAGGGTPHNNLPPYITCYMWKRTA